MARPAILATTPSAIAVVPFSDFSVAARWGVATVPLGADGVEGAVLEMALVSPLVVPVLGSVIRCSFSLCSYLRLVGPNRSLSSPRSRSPSSTRAAP